MLFLCRRGTRTDDLITICAHTQAFHFPERGICSWQANPSSVEPHLPSACMNMKERCWRLGSSRQRTHLLSSFPPHPRQPRRRQPTFPVALIRIGLRSQPWKFKLEAGSPSRSMTCPRLSLSRDRPRALDPKLLHHLCHHVHCRYQVQVQVQVQSPIPIQ